MKLREMWRRLVSTKYTGALEREVARLRLENRALLNSILGIAGVPPIVVAADDPAAHVAVGSSLATASAVASATPQPERNSEQSAAIAKRAAPDRGMKSVAAPMRRRSWHQIYRTLELDAARKKEIV